MFPGRPVRLIALPPIILFLSIASSNAVGVRPTFPGPPVTGASAKMFADFATNSKADDETAPESAVGTENVEKSPVRAVTLGVLDNISIVETPEKALVIFSTNGLVDYTVSTSAKLSGKWIEILFPTIRAGVPGHLDGGGRILGDIYTEDISSGSNGVRVSVEIIPSRIGYDLYQEGSVLVLRVLLQ